MRLPRGHRRGATLEETARGVLVVVDGDRCFTALDRAIQIAQARHTRLTLVVREPWWSGVGWCGVGSVFVQVPMAPEDALADTARRALERVPGCLPVDVVLLARGGAAAVRRTGRGHGCDTVITRRGLASL
ncbi:MAG: hypothetical protein JWO02_2186 [Solirubrobacterales bacterium]|nr:hypothetical protein [Solirubrobacterales bacterium]